MSKHTRTHTSNIHAGKFFHDNTQFKFLFKTGQLAYLYNTEEKPPWKTHQRQI